MRYACLHLPDFLIQAVSRAEPAPLNGGLTARAVAVVEGTHPPYRIVAVNAAARRAGVELGLLKLQTAPTPAVEIRRRSPAQEAAAHAALLDLGWSFSPRLEDAAADTVVLDLAGLDSLWGSRESLARALARRAAELGFEMHVALASNPEAARCAARGFAGITLIPPGHEAERLAALPVAALGPPDETLETLARWGILTAGALAALPTAELSERLGQAGVALQALARGGAARALVPTPPQLHFEEAMELDDPVAELEPLAFILSRLLNRLCARLSTRGLGAKEVRLELGLDKERVDPPAPCAPKPITEAGHQGATGAGAPSPESRTLTLPVPTQDPRLLLKLWRLHLEATPPQAPVLKVAFAAEAAKPRALARSLFLPAAPDPEKLELTLARIRGLVGEGKAGALESLDTHRPDAFQVRPFGESHRSDRVCHREPRRSATRMVLRLFRPPLAARVEMHAERPVRIEATHGVRGQVIAAAGPWRTSGEWWREAGWAEDEWDVEVRSVTRGGLGKSRVERKSLYRIFRDHASGQWFIRGTYD